MAEKYGSDESQSSNPSDRQPVVTRSTPAKNPDEVEVVLTRQWGTSQPGQVVTVSKIQAKSLVDHMMGDDTPEAVSKAKAAQK